VVVCVDPGHGGTDPGAVNEAFGLRESDVNLDVARGLRALLESQGAAVFLTRNDDIGLTNSDRYDYCNAIGATVLVSVHTNSVTDPTWDGTMTLYAPNRAPDLAAVVHESVYAALAASAPPGVATFTDFGMDNFASGVLFKCHMPAAMAEPLFMSHPAEAEALVQPIFDEPGGTLSEGCPAYSCRRGQIAGALAAGVSDYFGGDSLPLMHATQVELTPERKGASVFLSGHVAVADGAGAPIPGVATVMSIRQPDGAILFAGGTSEADGIAPLRIRVTQPGTYTYAVTSMSKDGWVYHPGYNVDSGGDLIVPAR
jgi:N-acetylmuramoyl-L-alanine amidase